MVQFHEPDAALARDICWISLIDGSVPSPTQ